MEKFELFDVVKVQSSDSSLTQIENAEGVILGFSDANDGERWCAVFVQNETWMVKSTDLINTGKKVKESDIYPK
ncbi:Imm31 family immunity protein [Collimonas humicola]|uniref:Imm31 family immunity protein n=1 Tax=Collimonas humicola TaxID=2825886 RepID=UPI001B8B4D13|nr:Imm31 family immunity protein [Collimonas humicola]